MEQKIIILKDIVNNSMKKTLIQMIYSGCSLGEEGYLMIGKEDMSIEDMEDKTFINISVDMLIMMKMEDKYPKTLEWLFYLNLHHYCFYWL